LVQVNSATPASHASDESSVRIPVDVRRFPWIRRLAADYAYDFRAVAPFFSGDPADRAAWADAIARTQAHDRRRDAIAAVINAQQSRRGAPPKAAHAGSLLADPRTVAVVTGQQAGLFGGPLFTLLKAMTALKLAEQVTRDHGVPAIAVFWIDAEDHDWEEVRSCTVFDETLTPHAVSLPARPGADPSPVATIRLESDAIHKALTELEQLLPHSEFRDSVMAGLRKAYEPGIGMADAFGRWLEHVLGDRGLVVYDSSDAATKPLVSQVFARELSMPGQTVKLASLAGSDLTARGYQCELL
jgi:bacillithiol synthase